MHLLFNAFLSVTVLSPVKAILVYNIFMGVAGLQPVGCIKIKFNQGFSPGFFIDTNKPK